MIKPVFIFFAGILFVATSWAQEIVVPKGIITLAPKPAPEIKLKDTEGKPFEMMFNRGRWLFVHFWATWCGPCRREMPTIQELQTRFKNQANFRIVLINTSETDDQVFSFLGIVAPSINSLMDYDGKVTERWQPRGLPSTYIVDPAGRIRYVALGGREWTRAEYSQFIQDLLASQVNQ